MELGAKSYGRKYLPKYNIKFAQFITDVENVPPEEL